MKVRAVGLLVLSGVLLLLLVACGGPSKEDAAPPPPQQPGLGSGALAPEVFTKDMTVQFNDTQIGLPSAERLIVRNVDMTLVVAKPAESLRRASDLAEELGGFVVSSWIAGEEEATASAFISLRVPSERLEEALARLRGLAVRVPREQSNSQDVTEEYVDLQSRLKSLEATEAQLLRLMERAEKVEEVLMVQRELSNVQQQIESLKGRMQYLERTSAMALVSVSLVAEASEAPLVTPGWSALEVVKRAVRGLSGVAQGLASAGIWAAIFVPFWLPLVAVAWWVVRRLRRPRPS